MITHPRMLNDRHGPLQVKIARSVYALHVLMCLLQAPREEIFYLILSPCLRSQKFFSGLKTSRNKFTEQLHQTESLPFSIRVISFFAPRCFLFSYRDQTNFLKLIMRGVLSALFTVALAVLPTQLKGSPKCLVRVSSKNELDLL